MKAPASPEAPDTRDPQKDAPPSRPPHPVRGPGRAALRSTFRSTRTWAWFGSLLTFVCLAYFFFVSAGFREHWPVYGTYHDLLADGFRNGDLHIPIEPAPQLLRAKDPYDPVNMRYWVLDATYYKGKYYIYWGPVPALMQAAAKSLLGIRRVIGDQYLSLVFLWVAFCSGAVLIERMARRLFGPIPKWLLVLSVLVFAFANPTVHAATTAGTYHTAIVAAQAWIVAGLVPAFEAVWRTHSQATQRLRLTIAGILWGLALASRLTVAPTLAIFILATGIATGWVARARWLKILENTFWVALPVCIAGLSLLLYNRLRFDDWFEFGSKIQVSAFPIHFSFEYFWANLYTYSLRMFEASCEFPYVFHTWRPTFGESFPDGFDMPARYLLLEPVVGWLVAVPLTWIGPLALLLVPARVRGDARQYRTYAWCVVCFGALASITGFIDLLVYTATMRYLSDVLYGMVLLSLMGAFALKVHRINRLFPKLISLVVGTLSVVTIAMGLAIGYHGYNGHFARYNPKLHRALLDSFSVCGDEQPKQMRYAP